MYFILDLENGTKGIESKTFASLQQLEAIPVCRVHVPVSPLG